MADNETRTARALEGIERQFKELVRVMAAVNLNLATFVQIVQKDIEDQKEEDSAQLKAWPDKEVDMNRNAVVHTSEFNNPEHRPLRSFPQGYNVVPGEHPLYDREKSREVKDVT